MRLIIDCEILLKYDDDDDDESKASLVASPVSFMSS